MSDSPPANGSYDGPRQTIVEDRTGMRIWGQVNAHPRLVRCMLAGPVTLIVTVAIMAGMTVWWPGGAAGIDQIAMPLILFPVIWVCVFVYGLMEDRLGRGCLVMFSLLLGNVALVALG